MSPMRMVNDTHCHFFSSRFLELLAPDGGGADALARRLGWDPPGTAASLADRWIQELDRNGVSRAALIASIPGDEASVGEAIARHPSRFVGLFFHNPSAPDAASSRARSFGDLRMSGICLFPAMHGYRLDDESVVDVFRDAAAHGAIVFVHCGMLTVGVRKKLGLPSSFDLRLGDPLALAKVALGFPDVPVIVPHFGAGYLRESLMAADQCPTIHFDTSSSNSWIKFHPGLGVDAVFAQALAVVGPERLIFGTDASFFPRGWQRGIFDTQQQIFDRIRVRTADRDLIFAGNFDRLFGPR